MIFFSEQGEFSRFLNRVKWVKHGVANSYLHKQTIQILRFSDFLTQGKKENFNNIEWQILWGKPSETMGTELRTLHVYAIHDSVSLAQILVPEVSFSTM